MRKPSRKTQVLNYLSKYVGDWVHNQQLRNLTGLNDVPRTLRLLRQEGWQIEARGDGYVRLTSVEKGISRGKRQSISEKTRYEVLSADSFMCAACGRGSEDGVKLNVDHIVPVDWGGTNDIANLQTLCDECNRGKKAFMASIPDMAMKDIMSRVTVEQRIEALFDKFPNEDIPSHIVRLVSKGAFDWQRALRRIRQRTGKKILPTKNRTAYRYIREG